MAEKLYGRLSVTATYSEDKDHKTPIWTTRFKDYEMVDAEGETLIVNVPTFTTTIVAANRFSSIKLLMMENMETELDSDPVLVAWTDNDSIAQSQVVPPGRVLVVPDVKGSVAVTARVFTSGGPSKCRFSVIGAA